jgi:hypothetical protein
VRVQIFNLTWTQESLQVGMPHATPGGSWPTLRAATMATSQSSLPQSVEQISSWMNVACMSPAHDCSALLRRWYHLLKRVNGVQQLASRYKRSVQKFAKTASGTVEHTPVLAFIECRSTNSASRYVLATLTRRWYIDPERNATGGTFHGLRNEETVERDVIGWCI